MIWTSLITHFTAIIATIPDAQGSDGSLLGPLLATGSNIFTGILTYIITSRRFSKQSSRREFDDLVEANKEFREEIKKELDQAKLLIEDLKKQINKKDQDMAEMQSSIADLKNQISIRETSISELNTQIMKRDLKIADLERRINKMSSE